MIDLFSKKKKTIERLTIEDLTINHDDIDSKTEVLSQYVPPQKNPGKVLEGELAQQTAQLVDLLRNEAKVV